MKSLMKKVREFVRNEEGQGLVEYALILALIAIVVIAAVSLIGTYSNKTYCKIAGSLNR